MSCSRDNIFMKKIIWIIVIIIVALGLYFAFRPSTPVSTEPIKIGVSTILSGDLAAGGQNMVWGAELAVERINNSGGVNGRMIKLFVEDARCDSRGGLNAASKLINISGVKYIIGGTCSNGTLAAAPLANERKVLYLTPVTGGSNNDNAGEYVFRTANSDVLAGRDLANAMFKLGYRRVGTVTEITEYTLDIKTHFKKVMTELGGSVKVEEDFQPGTRDFRTVIAKMKSENLNAVVILSQTGISGGSFVKQTKELQFSVPLFSDFLLAANEDAKKIAGSLDGIYFADPAYDAKNPELKTFFAEYEQRFGRSPLIPFHAASTYDNIQMIAAAIKEVGDDSEKVHDWLITKVKNWRGFMGVYSLDEKGNSDLGFVIKIVTDGKPQPEF